MKYTLSGIDHFCFDNAYISPCDNKIIIINAVASADNPENGTGKNVIIPEMEMKLSDMKLEKASLFPLEYYSPKDKKVHKTKEHTLYKSELPALADKIFSEPSDIFSINAEKFENGYVLTAELNFEEGSRELYSAVMTCTDISVSWDCFGDVIEKKKLTLKEQAKLLKSEVPAVILSLSDKRTPAVTKLIAAVAVAYALSPIDLIPDFIPVLGYLDDVLILSGLIYMAVRLIPPDVMEESRRKARENYYRPKKRKIYGLPVVLIWTLVLALIIYKLIN